MFLPSFIPFFLSLFFDTLNLIFNKPENIPILLTGIICFTASIICLINLPKLNKAGRMRLGNILGFKQFLEVAEKENIEQLVRTNPSYCYDILPYAYVLGVSDEWIKKFESIVQYTPNWYQGNFYKDRFSQFTDSLYNASIPTYTNGGIPKSSSSRHHSSHGGGGHSGGGHGGGRGGSW